MRAEEALPATVFARAIHPSCLIELARPRLVSLGLATIALVYVVAAVAVDWGGLALTLVGSLLALCGASAANQALEWRNDARMRRTAHRPVPSGRVAPGLAAAYGVSVTVLGLVVLAYGVAPLTAAIAASGWLVYVGLYTPLKARHPVAITVGAVAGAVPVLIGWSAGAGELSVTAWWLYGVMVLWQLPHFLAIGWMYRADYARAGLRLLPGPGGEGAPGRAVAHAALLVPASLGPWLITGELGAVAGLAALLGLYYLHAAWRLRGERTSQAARGVVRASVVYLPALLILMLVSARVA